MSNETAAMKRPAAATVRNVKVRNLTVTAFLAAVAFILMYFEFSVPFMPSFIALDVSELPGLIGAFAIGPVSGVLICLIKNVLHMTVSRTAFVGELSNFILGAVFVFTAGMIYRHKKTKKSAVTGAVAGAVAMALFSVVSNYFVVYPFYYNFMPKEVILGMYQAINPRMNNILECLICFNLPFTFMKAMLSVIITLFIYKPLSPILKGKVK